MGKILKQIMISILLIGLIHPVQAKDFGTFGETFKIEELDLVEVILSKLHALDKAGGLLEHHQKIQARIKQQVHHPEPVKGLSHTKVPRTFEYNPSLHVPYDLKDNQGKVFVKAGTIVNPLETHTLKNPLLFIDGQDTAQIDWALQQPDSKIILVSGAPLKLMKKYHQRFYFDQGGVLSKKLGLVQVPARLRQYQKRLLVEELLISPKIKTVRQHR